MILGVLLFLRKDRLQQAPRGRIMGSNEADHLLVGIDRDALSDQILAYQRLQRVAGDLLRMAALGEATRIEIRLAVELHYSGSDAIGVRKFLLRGSEIPALPPPLPDHPP